MALKALGILTRDFAAYYDLVAHLKERDIPFLSLSFDRPIPSGVGVVLTTPAEAGSIAFPVVVGFEGDAQRAVDHALEALKGRPRYGTVVVGVDPGERPGIAVYGDGRLLRVEQAGNPERVVDEVARAMEGLAAEHFVVRIGHGGGVLRDRIINELLRSDRTSRAVLEVVDETRTSQPPPGEEEPSDIAAAKAIAMAQGFTVHGFRDIRPTEGEVRNIQLRSRIVSGGFVTISRELASEVARGRLGLDEAIARQRHASAKGSGTA